MFRSFLLYFIPWTTYKLIFLVAVVYCYGQHYGLWTHTHAYKSVRKDGYQQNSERQIGLMLAHQIRLYIYMPVCCHICHCDKATTINVTIIIIIIAIIACIHYKTHIVLVVKFISGDNFSLMRRQRISNAHYTILYRSFKSSTCIVLHCLYLLTKHQYTFVCSMLCIFYIRFSIFGT